MYTIQAIPTVYKGRKYRSRLEAKWAAFFDHVGWRYEYEPFDLGEWSPDFLLISDDGCEEVLVEIKPISQLEKAVCDRMERAANLHNCRSELMLLGTIPIIEESVLPWNGTGIGWLAEPCEGKWFWSHAGAGQYKGKIDFSHEYGSYHGRITGCGYKAADSLTVLEINAAWSAAANAVQWHKHAHA